MHKNEVAVQARRRRRGFSLVEIAMVLAIGALVVAGVMMYFNNANVSAKTNEAMSQLSSIQETVRTLYQGQSDYSGIDTATLASSQLVPNKYKKGTNALRSPFGADITIATGAGNNQFAVTYAKVPDLACQRMVTADLGTGVVSLTIGSGAAILGKAATPAQASSQCAGGTTGNDITWIFN